MPQKHPVVIDTMVMLDLQSPGCLFGNAKVSIIIRDQSENRTYFTKTLFLTGKHLEVRPFFDLSDHKL